MTKFQVIVLMGGKTPEHEISLITGQEVAKNLDKRKYTVFPFVIPRQGIDWQKKFFSALEIPLPTVVFIAMHGPFGEDGTIQGMMELIGLPYTGAGVLASALGMDKIMFRKVMKQKGILVPPYLVFNSHDSQEKILRKSKFPLVVKPSNQGSSVGVSIVHQKSELKKALKKAFDFSDNLLIEKYLLGTEVSCGVLGNRKPVALPVIEICPKNEFFDYEAKYQADKCEEIVPARISKKLTHQVQDLAVRVFQAIDCRGFGRVDMIIRQGKPYVLEINTIPGLTPNSLFPKEAASAGISYSQLLDRLIELALEKW